MGWIYTPINFNYHLKTRDVLELSPLTSYTIFCVCFIHHNLNECHKSFTKNFSALKVGDSKICLSHPQFLVRILCIKYEVDSPQFAVIVAPTYNLFLNSGTQFFKSSQNRQINGFWRNFQVGYCKCSKKVVWKIWSPYLTPFRIFVGICKFFSIYFLIPRNS